MKKKVLFVDDEPMFRAVLARMLFKAGYDADELDSSEGVMELLEKNQYYCIVLDYCMPMGMNGLELADMIRKHDNPVISTVPILLLTGWLEMEIIDNAEKIGIDLFRQKKHIVTSPEGITEAIESTVSRNELHLINNTLMLIFKER